MNTTIPTLSLLTLPFLLASAQAAQEVALPRVELAVYAELDASAEGKVPVVVALDLAAVGDESTAARRAAIEEAQELLLADLAGTEFELLCRYRTFAALAGRAGEQALARLGVHPLVKSVGPSARFTASLEESVPHIRADQVQALGFTGTGITVAVLDTGIQTSHPDFAGSIAPGAWHSLGDGTNQGPGAEDDNGHGTHVSGIITSVGAVAPVGVAPGTQILAVKVLDSAGNGTLIDVLAGIDYVTASVTNYDALVALNMSLATFVTYTSCPCNSADTLTMSMQAALAASKSAGIANFAASGNNGSCTRMAAPACLSAATAVAATHDTSDDVASLSNRNACNELAAPGRDITASWIGGGTAELTGTSMAAPHASAVAALMVQRARTQCLALTPDEIVQIMKDTAAPTSDPCNTTPNPRRVDALSAFLAIELDPWELYCFGDGSASACPCANESAAGTCAGCASSVGMGASLRAVGSPSLAADDLVLTVASALPGQPALLFAGEAAIGAGAGAPFGDGLRCAGVNAVRLGIETPDGAGSASFGPGLPSLAEWPAGEERFLQVWYRDPVGSPCGSGFNLTNGLSLELLP